MYRHRNAREVVTRVAALGAVLGLAACSGAPLQGPGGQSGTPSEIVSQTSAPLLAQPCSYATSSTPFTLQVHPNEIAYIGYQKGCVAGTTETSGNPPIPCVITNAVDASGQVCRVASGAAITVKPISGGSGSVETAIFDYSYGYFGIATSATASLVNVTLDSKSGGPSSLLKVLAPKLGGNMVVGANGVVVNTCKTAAAGSNCASVPTAALRSSGVKLDIAVAWTGTTGSGMTLVHNPGNFEFDGYGYALDATPSTGAGNIFTADLAGWVTPMGWAPPTAWTAPPFWSFPSPWTTTSVLWPAGWDTESDIATIVGASFGGSVTAYGGPGDDVFSGGTSASNALYGYGGDDYFFQSQSARTEAIFGGDGFDTVDYSLRSNPMTVGIGAGATSGDEGTPDEDDSIANDVEMAKGGSGNDVMWADSSVLWDVVLLGQGGNDQLTGGAGADDLCGGDGDDILFWSGATASVTETGDYMVGGVGNDKVDYSAANISGTAAGVKVCLNPTDTLCTVSSVQQGGVAGETDVINAGSTVKACPRASFVIGDVTNGHVTYTTGSGKVPTGPAMAVDVENLTGPTAKASTLSCDALGATQATLPCQVIGSSDAAGDVLQGAKTGGAIVGGGGQDIVTTNGGNEEVDLSADVGLTSPNFATVNCASAMSAPTILFSAANCTVDPTTCAGATLVAF